MMANDDIARHMERVARAIMGEPNLRLSSKTQLRYGTNGSLSFDLAKGTFYDHENGEGGGVLKFIEIKERLTGKDAIEWMYRQGCDVEQPKTNGAGHSAPHTPRTLVATFDYWNEEGVLEFQVLRYEPKSFLQRKPNGHGGWLWEGGPPILYRLPEVLKAIAEGRTVHIVEGEGKADLLWSWGLVATCNAGGSRNWKSEHSDYLRGADCVCVPDNDDAGFGHVDKVGEMLTGIAARVRVLVLPSLPPKGDIVDWAAGGGTREQLLALVDQAQDWKPQAPPPADDENKDKAKATAGEDEIIAALEKMRPGIEFSRRRAAAAKQLNVPARLSTRRYRRDVRPVQMQRQRRCMGIGQQNRRRKLQMVTPCCAILSGAKEVRLSRQMISR